jgi:hypothetical protein
MLWHVDIDLLAPETVLMVFAGQEKLFFLPFCHIHLASTSTPRLSLPILLPLAPLLAAMAQPPTFFDGAHHFRMDHPAIYSIAGNQYQILNVQQGQ